MIEIKISGVDTVEIFATGDRSSLLAECNTVVFSAAEILAQIDESTPKEKSLKIVCAAAQDVLPIHNAFATVACNVELTDGEDGNGE